MVKRIFLQGVALALAALAAVACGGSATLSGDSSDGGAGGSGTGGATTACARGQQDYSTLSATLLSIPQATSCQVDADCAELQGIAACGYGCGQGPVSAAAKAGIEAQLSALAESECSTCPIAEYLCAAPPPPGCVAASACLITRSDRVGSPRHAVGSLARARRALAPRPGLRAPARAGRWRPSTPAPK